MNYEQISKETVAHLYKCHESLKQSPLKTEIQLLIELRVSQINGCAYCCALHSKQARALGIAQEKLDILDILNPTAGWHQSPLFTEEEKIALDYAEALTYLNDHLKEALDKVKSHFSEREVVDMTLCISLMNSLNRLAIPLKD